MQILIVCPAPRGSRRGNRVTADRWAGHLRQLGHRVQITDLAPQPRRCDVLIALHARRSAAAVRSWRRNVPEVPIVVTLTGTDLYQDIRTSAQARSSLRAADRLIVLHPGGIADLPAAVRRKTRVVVQSARPLRHPPGKPRQFFKASVLGHLRPVKDPFRAALATRHLAGERRVRVAHAGAAMTASMERRASALSRELPAYRWVGELSRGRARQLLAGSHIMILSSRMEGGANVLCEALALDVPVLSSRISGSVGLLGEDYPGYFTVGDTAGLAALLSRAANDLPFYRTLQRRCRRQARQVQPRCERRALKSVLGELS